MIKSYQMRLCGQFQDEPFYYFMHCREASPSSMAKIAFYKTLFNHPNENVMREQHMWS